MEIANAVFVWEEKGKKGKERKERKEEEENGHLFLRKGNKSVLLTCRWCEGFSRNCAQKGTPWTLGPCFPLALEDSAADGSCRGMLAGCEMGVQGRFVVLRRVPHRLCRVVQCSIAKESKREHKKC